MSTPGPRMLHLHIPLILCLILLSLGGKKLAEGRVYPSVSSIRDISVRVAHSVMVEALNEGLFGGVENRARFVIDNRSSDYVHQFIRKCMFMPGYGELVYSPHRDGS